MLKGIRENLSLIDVFFFSGVYSNNDVNKFTTIVIFDCRGVEPVDFEPKSGWIAEAEDNGTYLYVYRQPQYL